MKTSANPISLVLLGAVFGAALNAQQWQRTEKTDAFRGTPYSEFKIAGHYLTAPKESGTGSPILTVLCQSGKHLRVFNGRFLTGFISTGAVLETQVTEHIGILTGKSFASSIPVQIRLDDGKIQHEQWDPSKDGTSIFFRETALNNLLYGHTVPHKESTSPPVRKVVLAVDQFLAGEIVIQFDMPDPFGIADTCGTLVHKK